MDHLLPGIEPTGRLVESAFIVIVGIGNDKVAYEHILWDQASMLVQLGLLDPESLPVVWAGAAATLKKNLHCRTHFSMRANYQLQGL
ncbi:hypothetical protein GL2_19000 [Microbulbifer sp. GL-2]|nr:hypothetical protein GL2_19000 [Microbulbifer sp. GL-2]